MAREMVGDGGDLAPDDTDKVRVGMVGDGFGLFEKLGRRNPDFGGWGDGGATIGFVTTFCGEVGGLGTAALAFEIDSVTIGRASALFPTTTIGIVGLNFRIEGIHLSSTERKDEGLS